MRSFFTFIALFSVLILNAQVGIGTTTPKASLDIQVADKTNPTNIDGILIPRVEKFPSSNPGADQHGMLIFLSDQFLGNPTGFYYWDAKDSKWKSIISDAGASNFFKDGTLVSPNNIDDPIFRKGNVGIGIENTTAKLQVAVESSKDIAIKKGLEIDNKNPATDNLTTYGIISTNRSTTNGNKYGIKNNVSGDGIGIHYGIFNESFQNTGTNDIYGIFNRVGRTYGAKSNNYGIYSEIGSVTGQGNIYGIYSIAFGDNNSNIFAAYFAGRVGIGNSALDDYVLPATRGKEGQVLVTADTGVVTWRHPGTQNYSSTTSSTGIFTITDDIHTLRINNQVSGLAIPEASKNKGRIIILIGWPGISFKSFSFTGGDDIYDIVNDVSITGISGKQRMMIQSAGNRWILIGN
ncbi:hypothetical protein [Salegentibacter chungangensis]|uniref:Uncharacterized protein n=1 Tax=Salegentibacter chungangensis TaxID=1335724 RepID=A0ABW3NR71_9FLAO